MHPANLAIHLDDSGPSCPLWHAVGTGSAGDPLRVALLVRHSDMADEATPDEARHQAEQVLAALAAALAAGDSGRLAEALVETQPTALATGTYYSCLLAVLAGGHLAVAGVGKVGARLWGEELPRTLLAPTVLPGVPGVLTSALGLGFDPQAVATGGAELAAGRLAVLAAGAAEMRLPEPASLLSPAELLRRIQEVETPAAPLLAVLEGPTG